MNYYRDEDDYCDHVCDEECEDEQGYNRCRHEHCFNCGDCDCAGYCDDYQTYNLRPSETGGAPGCNEDHAAHDAAMPCERCGQPAPEGNILCALCEVAAAGEALAALRAAAAEHGIML